MGWSERASPPPSLHLFLAIMWLSSLNKLLKQTPFSHRQNPSPLPSPSSTPLSTKCRGTFIVLSLSLFFFPFLIHPLPSLSPPPSSFSSYVDDMSTNNICSRPLSSSYAWLIIRKEAFPPVSTPSFPPVISIHTHTHTHTLHPTKNRQQQQRQERYVRTQSEEAAAQRGAPHLGVLQKKKRQQWRLPVTCRLRAEG